MSGGATAVKTGMISVPGERFLRLTKGPNVLSIDCGISHLSYCLLEDTGGRRNGDKNDIDFSIFCWELVNLNATDIKGVTEALIAQFDKRSWMVHADAVVIEGQRPQNTEMKTLSHVIQAYFICRRSPLVNRDFVKMATPLPPTKYNTVVEFIRPSSKFSHLPAWVVDTDPNENAKTKAIRITADILKTKFGSHSSEFEYFLSHFKKADDLADSFLQGLYYLKVISTRIGQKKFLQCLLLNEGNIIDLDASGPDNESIRKMNDEELPRHLVFKAPLYRAKTFAKTEEFILSRSIVIDRRLDIET